MGWQSATLPGKLDAVSVSWIPRIGNEFGGYRLEGLIGHGGMSIVYRAQHLKLERTVALKLLAPELSDDESFRERFTRESRLAAALDHPNVIPIYEAGDEDGVFFIAMRYVPGSNLKTLLHNEGPLDAVRAVSIIGQVASALNAAHDLKGLVHRDVKPANILIADGQGADDAPHVYLSDFGIAKQRSSSVLTKTGMFVGTADYASPEQIEGKELDRRADIYSLGCVLYECLTGNPAYEKDSEVALMYAHLLEPPPSLKKIRPDLPPEIDDVLAKAMAKSRDERYETTRDFSSALRGVLAPDRVTSTGVTSSETVLAPSPSAPAVPPAGATTASPSPPPQQVVRPAEPSGPGDASGPAVPSGPGGPSDPGVPPAPGGQRGPGGRPGMGRKPLIAAAAVLALLALGILAGVLLLGGDDEGSTGTTTGQQELTTLLATVLPTGIGRTCTNSGSPSPGAVETIECAPPEDAPGSDPDEFTLSFYPSAAALQTAYDDAKDGITIGNCGPTSGEKTWIHKETGNRGGRRICGIEDSSGDAVVVWTHEKLGSPDHADMLGFARDSGRGADLFRRWWNGNKDNLGKCRPKLSDDTCATAVQALLARTPAS